MNDMERFQGYTQLADTLIGNATREQLIELAQVLAVHVGHYRSKFGDYRLR